MKAETRQENTLAMLLVERWEPIQPFRANFEGYHSTVRKRPNSGLHQSAWTKSIGRAAVIVGSVFLALLGSLRAILRSHYGQLVVYSRLMGLVPPASRAV
jgi:hypothetical protein